MQPITIQFGVRVRINRENKIIQLYTLICQMVAPNYPRNGNQRSRPNHRKQTNGGDDLRFGPAPISLFGFNPIDKMDNKIGLIVVEAIRGRCASFMIPMTRFRRYLVDRQNSYMLLV